jgi:hypothetical protein
MKDLITLCVLCFILSVGVDIFWLHGKYIVLFVHSVVAAIR